MCVARHAVPRASAKPSCLLALGLTASPHSSRCVSKYECSFNEELKLTLRLLCPIKTRLPSARKRLAVPFRAADTPSERSEYAQPDVALLLTYLSYFYDGLTKEQLRSALEQLVDMGLNAQRDFYNDWLRLSLAGIPEGVLLAFWL